MKTLLVYLLLLVSVNAGTICIAWNPNPVSENILGYKIYHGIRLVKTVTGCKATVTLPDSGIQSLSVSAYNAISEGPTSKELKVVPVIVQTSNELKIWEKLTTIYIEQQPKMFFRLTPPIQ